MLLRDIVRRFEMMNRIGEREMGETERRREKQVTFNELHGITPRSIVKQVKDLIDGVYSEKAGKEAEKLERDAMQRAQVEDMSEKDISREIKRLEKLMMEHARNLERSRLPGRGDAARPHELLEDDTHPARCL
mgnify:CR=1 FL=1